ncbi:hypothetical protein KC352_g41496, partial [Hortaea werneckii]
DGAAELEHTTQATERTERIIYGTQVELQSRGKRLYCKAKSPTSEVSASISGSSSNNVSFNDLIPMQLAMSFEESDVELVEALFGLEKPVVIAMPKP